MRRFWIVLLVLAAAAGLAVWAGWHPPGVARVAALVASGDSRASQGEASAAGTKTTGPGDTGTGAHGGKNRSIAVVTAEAKAGSMPNTRQTIGYVRPLASADLTTETLGIVVSVNAKDGAEVKTGDLLAKLDDRAAQAAVSKDRAALARDTATLDDAKLTLQRTRKLLSTGAATQQAFDDAQSTVESAEATIAVDQASLDADQVLLDKTEIRAPFDGRLGAFQVSVGSLAQPTTSIVSIVQTKPVYAEFSLAETDLAILRQSQQQGQLSVTVRPSLAPAGMAPIEGPIVFIDNQVDQSSATVRLRALLRNDDAALLPNQSIDVTVEAGLQDNLVLVPNVAVQPRQDGSIAYVVKSDSTIEVRKVEVSLRSETEAGLSKGLAPGEKVVVEGQLDLADGTAVREVKAKASPGGGALPNTGADAEAAPAGGEAASGNGPA